MCGPSGVYTVSGVKTFRLRLLIDQGTRRAPAVVPIAVFGQDSIEAATAAAVRLGRTFYPATFLGVVSPRSVAWERPAA